MMVTYSPPPRSPARARAREREREGEGARARALDDEGVTGRVVMGACHALAAQPQHVIVLPSQHSHTSSSNVIGRRAQPLCQRKESTATTTAPQTKMHIIDV